MACTNISSRETRILGVLIAQMAPQYSRDHWQLSDDETFADVEARVATLLKEPLPTPIFTDIEHWRDALPKERADAQWLNKLTLPLGLAFCGDAFVCGVSTWRSNLV
jgi:renalase